MWADDDRAGPLELTQELYSCQAHLLTIGRYMIPLAAGNRPLGGLHVTFTAREDFPSFRCPHADATRGKNARKKVLLIEDDPDSRSIYGTVLRTAGFVVVEARDGKEGVQLAQDHLPDLILMDLGLPGLDEFTATETLPSRAETSHIPFVVITVHVQDFYRGRAAAIGCNSFLEKPCGPDRLVGEVARILNLPS